MSRKRRLRPDGIHDDFFGVLFRAWPQCVSRHRASRTLTPPLRPDSGHPGPQKHPLILAEMC